MKDLKDRKGNPWTMEKEKRAIAIDIATIALVGTSVGIESITMNFGLLGLIDAAAEQTEKFSNLKGAALEANRRARREKMKATMKDSPPEVVELARQLLRRAQEILAEETVTQH